MTTPSGAVGVAAVQPAAAAATGEPDPALISAAVRSCPAVVDLWAGTASHRVATYLPGRRVPGIAVRAGEIEVAVVVRYGATPADVARQIRLAVGPLAGGRRVDVVIADVELPGEPSAPPTPSARATADPPTPAVPPALTPVPAPVTLTP